MIDSSYKLTAILFGIGVTLHNLEEGMFLANWFRSHVKLWFEPNPKIYWFLTSLVSVVVWIPVVGVCISAEGSHFQDALSGFALVMVINVVFPHLALSLSKRSYSPGVGTAILFNLPLGALLIKEHLNSPAASPAEVWRAAVLYGLLFAVGTLGSLYAAHALTAAKKVRAQQTISPGQACVPRNRVD